MFIYKLWCIAKSFIQYLCYRKDISPLSADLYAPYEDNKHERFATLYVLGHDVVPEHEPLKKGCYIKQAHIAGFEGRILSDLAGGLLYTRHLPESYESGRHYDAARFVMITAAFEWEFRHTYPQGIPKKDCRLMAEKEVQKTLHALIEKSTGKVKSIYKHLEKMVGKDPLQSQLVHISNDC